MNKEFNSIGTNTDPLGVQLYFDENNSIKWKIVFKDPYQNTISEYLTQPYQSNLPIQPNQLNQPAQQIQLTQSTQLAQPTQQPPDHIITSIFSNIYLIAAKLRYSFKYIDIQLEMDDSEQIKHEIEYNSFDYFKYNKIIGEQLEKNIAWKHYLKSMKKSQMINLDLDPIEISQINAMINIINMAIELGQKECVIIMGDFSPNSTNIAWFKKNKEKYEISKGKIILLWYSNSNPPDSNEKKISQALNFKDIKAFVIKSSLYTSFLKKLTEKKITWECCLAQCIEENQFESYQIVPQLFF